MPPIIPMVTLRVCISEPDFSWLRGNSKNLFFCRLIPCFFHQVSRGLFFLVCHLEGVLLGKTDVIKAPCLRFPKELHS